MVKYAVLSEDAAVAGVVQLGLLGQNAAVKRGGYLMDMNFGGLVQVLQWKSKNAPLGLIGCSVGANTINRSWRGCRGRACCSIRT